MAPSAVRLIPRDPQWLHDFHLTHDLLLAPYHAAWRAREQGEGGEDAPAYPPCLERLTGLDAPAALDAWTRVRRAFPPALRRRPTPYASLADPTHGSALRAPDGRRLVPLHAVTLDEADLRALVRVRRALRAGAKAQPSLLVTHHADGSADIESVASPGEYRGTVERTVAVLTLAADEDVETLAALLDRESPNRRVDLTDPQYAAYERFADRLASAAMTGQFHGDRALFRSRY